MKAAGQGRAAKAKRRARRQQRRAPVAIQHEATSPELGLMMPGATEPWGFVRGVPIITPEELQTMPPGERPSLCDVDIEDPTLMRILDERVADWDTMETVAELWSTVPKPPAVEFDVPDGVIPQALAVGVSITDDDERRPVWYANYPRPSDAYDGEDERFATRDDLVDALDRLESMYLEVQFPKR